MGKTPTRTRHSVIKAALLGCAVGDAYGAPLEFLRGEDVRTREVMPTEWTDDTQMALALANALIEFNNGHRSLPLHTYELGYTVAQAFSEWYADPGHSPGSTCLTAAKRIRNMGSGSWMHTGDSWSDGCGAVMRIAPLVALPQSEAVHAAWVQASITHNTVNAISAARAGAFLMHRLARNESLHMATRLVIDSMSGWRGSSNARASLVEALDHSTPFEAIPPEDGGWRAHSCLGIAVASVLRTESFEEAIEMATRHDGDSDSTGAVAGTLAGILYGHEAIPPRWLDSMGPDKVEHLSTVAALLAGPVIPKAS